MNSGTDCDRNACHNENCRNGGTCIANGEEFSCLCNAGYSGDICEFTPCSDVWCANSGLCAVKGSSFGFTNKICHKFY